MPITKGDNAAVVFPGAGALRRLAARVEARHPGPAWASLPTWVGGVSLVVAVAGLYWDVAFHVDHGRDVKTLFTIPHLLILVGLLGLGASALVSILVATATGARTRLRLGPVRLPAAGLAMLWMATGAAIGFPLDNLWHEVYGVDVTLWSPTHLLMIGGAVFATLALNLLAAEGRAASRSAIPRWQAVSLAGSVLIGLVGFQAEFDYGVPQWQALYQPVLIAIAAGFGLCLARAAIGRGGAVLATGFYLGLRVLLALLVWRLGYTVPSFPLLLGCALCVEAAFLLEDRLPPLPLALLAGLLVGTAGLATEWGWNHLAFPAPLQWQPSLLGRFWVPLLAAPAAAWLGTATGRVVGGLRAGLPAPAGLGAFALLVLLLAVPFPRGGQPLKATMTTAAVGPQRFARDRYGQPSYEQDEAVTVQLVDPRAVRSPDWFMVLAWQGGGRRLIALVPDGPGRWRTAQPVPTGGAWKSVVFLAAGPQVLAAPIYFPPDPTYGSAGYQVAPGMTRSMGPGPQVLMSETHGGPPYVAVLAYLALAVVAAGWFLSLALAARLVSAASRADWARPAAARRTRLA